jgi:hypothetical protein
MIPSLTMHPKSASTAADGQADRCCRRCFHDVTSRDEFHATDERSYDPNSSCVVRTAEAYEEPAGCGGEGEARHRVRPMTANPAEKGYRRVSSIAPSS